MNLSLTIRNADAGSNLPFQALLELPPGFQRHQLDAGDITELVDLSRAFEITFSPNITEERDEGLELLFGVLSFVRDDASRQSRGDSGRPLRTTATKHVKVIACRRRIGRHRADHCRVHRHDEEGSS